MVESPAIPPFHYSTIPLDAKLRSSAAPTFGGNPQEDSNGHPAREQERTAIAEERKWNPGDRQKVECHADIFRHVREPEREQSERDEASVRIIRSLRHANDAKEKHEKQRQRQRDPEISKLLAHDGENEVGMLLRQERQS